MFIMFQPGHILISLFIAMGLVLYLKSDSKCNYVLPASEVAVYITLVAKIQNVVVVAWKHEETLFNNNVSTC